ncbi:hypothetical protein SAMN05216374_4620 [Tardiphaga sp. OK246]|jgi:hypothetical protein|nr:hypothetical protein SAMN05216374_4620 [Tardiphaga sp. OK246]
MAEKTRDKNILNHVVAYFAWRFKRPPKDFKPSLEVRKAWRSADDWADLADTFNDMSWMKTLRVRITQSEMSQLTTIGEIVDLIEEKAGSRLNRLSGAEFGAVKRAWPF